MSTGPHLHYEVIVNGKKVNSQKLKLPSGKVLENDERTSDITILFESTLNSIKVPPLKSIPKFKPLKKISSKLPNTRRIEVVLANLNFDSKLYFFFIL